jgi:hypothetical protein
MATIGAVTLRPRRGGSQHGDSAVRARPDRLRHGAFIPPAYFAGISTTRHVAGSNLAMLLALTLSVALAVSMGYRATTRALARPRAHRGYREARRLFPLARLRPGRWRQPLPSPADLD